MSRRIFIGDIHGETGQLKTLINGLTVQEDDELIFLGDYIDRGSDSKGVLAVLKQVKKEFPNTRLIWGNHELHLYEWLTENNPMYLNMIEGVRTLQNLVGQTVKFSSNNTLYGYGINQKNSEDTDYLNGIRNIDKEVKDFLLREYRWLFESLEDVADYPEQVAVHGGLNFTKEDPVTDTTLYVKVNMRLNVSGNPLPKPIIVGHTPKKSITLTEDRKMVLIDTGCGSGGNLSALIYYPTEDRYEDAKGKRVNVRKLEDFNTEEEDND